MNTQYARINITLPKELLNRFQKYCKEEGMTISSRIAVLIKRDISGK